MRVFNGRKRLQLRRVQLRRFVPVNRKRIGLAVLAAVLAISLYTALPARAAITFQSGSSGENGTGGTTVTIAAPSVYAAGDVMIAVVSAKGGSGTSITPPSGWTLLHSADNTTNNKSSVYYKVATSSESSVSFTLTPSVKAVGILAVYRGVDTSTITSNHSAVAKTATQDATAPTRTTTVANSLVIGAFSNGLSTSYTPASGSTFTPVRVQAASSGVGAPTTKAAAGLVDYTMPGTGSVTPDIRVNDNTTYVGHTIILTPDVSVAQVGYRWFENSTTAGTVGAPLAAQNTSIIAPGAGTPFRLRLLLGVSELSLGTTKSFNLEYMAINSGNCTSDGYYFPVTTSSPVRFYDNSGVNDATNIVASANDPVRAGVTKVNQTYEEANSFSPSTAVPVGQDGMWDFSLAMSSNAGEGSTYCLRVVSSTGGLLSSYSAIPAIKAPMLASSLDGKNYRLYQNANSLSPGIPLAAANTSATLETTGASFRLRADVSVRYGYKALSAQGFATCAIAINDQAYCWGNGANGGLGNNSTSDSSVPVAVDTSGVLSGKTIKMIDRGTNHGCVIAIDDLAYCWGQNGLDGKLGNNSTSDSSVPVAVDTSGVLSGKTFKIISASVYTTCAIASDDQAYCWGNGVNGELGYGGTSDQRTPVAVINTGVLSGKTLKDITTGEYHTCAIASDNQAYCWGSNSSGKLGNNSTNQSSTPVAVSTSGVLNGKTIKKLTSGTAHNCVIASDDQVYCWGDNEYGQLGNNSTSDSSVPVAVDTSGVLSGKTIKTIDSSLDHTCVVASDDQAYCWGYGTLANLGNNDVSSHAYVPVAVDTSGVLSGRTAKSAVAGADHGCVIANDGLAYCWGDNTNGEVGDNSTNRRTSPVGTVSWRQALASPSTPVNDVIMKLQYAQKTQASCAVQTGFTDITGSTVISYIDNSSVSNGTTITSTADDPVSSSTANMQSYHDIPGLITNPNPIELSKTGLWDMALRDNGALPNTSYCLRLAGGNDGAVLGSYANLPEIRTAASSGGGGGPTIDQQMRGGQSVINGVKGPFTW